MAVIHRPAAFCTGRLWWTRHPTLYARSMIAFWNWASVTACAVVGHRVGSHAERLFANVAQAMVVGLDGRPFAGAWAQSELEQGGVCVFAADHVHAPP